MNNVREIERINERELNLALEGGASWHDDYKDSAYIFVGGLDKRLTEGDVISIFSQYGEILDINLPKVPEGGLRRPAGGIDVRDGEATPQQRQQQQEQGGKAGERRGFGFLLYEDQRSTVLAVDNLNGYNLVGRTLRVDHVRDYKMPDAKRREEAGEEIGPSRNAAPQMVDDDDGAAKGRASGTARAADNDIDDEIDAEDPMAAYFRSKGNDKSESHGRGDENDADRRRRKEERRLIREERERKKASRSRQGDGRRDRLDIRDRDYESRSSRPRSRSPIERDQRSHRTTDERRRHHSPNHSRDGHRDREDSRRRDREEDDRRHERRSRY